MNQTLTRKTTEILGKIFKTIKWIRLQTELLPLTPSYTKSNSLNRASRTSTQAIFHAPYISRKIGVYRCSKRSPIAQPIFADLSWTSHYGHKLPGPVFSSAPPSSRGQDNGVTETPQPWLTGAQFDSGSQLDRLSYRLFSLKKIYNHFLDYDSSLATLYNLQNSSLLIWAAIV